MKALPVCSGLLLCASYATLVGCNNAMMTQRIQINNCIATPDPVSVHDTESVIWIPDVDYQVTFVPTNTPTGPAIPVTSNAFVVKAGTSVPHVMHAPSNCSTAGCYYKYGLTRMKNSVPESVPCVDPGIRIVPGNAGG